jgi:hypothetical protein
MADKSSRGLLVGVAIIALAAPWQTPVLSQPYSDVASHTEAGPAINSMLAQGIMRGVSPTQFAPEASLTHGDFVIAIRNMFNLPRTDQAIGFLDVDASSPVYAALQGVEPYLGGQILCPGCALGKNFMPGQPISSAEVTFTVTRVLAAQNRLQLVSPAEVDSVLSEVPDASQLPRPSRVYFATAIRTGILPVGPGNRIEPASKVTRADAAVLLDRVQQKFDIPRVQSLP